MALPEIKTPKKMLYFDEKEILMKHKAFSLFLVAACLAFPGVGDAKDHKHNGKHKIRESDRVVIQNYLREDYRHSCPPGLAKKHNGCRPPGQAKKYHIGDTLPDYVVLLPVPRDVLVHLHPVEPGYRYVQVDKDIYLIGEASKKIIDAVTLLSAVGN
jgi:hypothetical protein